MNDEIRSQAAATSRSKTLGRSLAWWGVALIAIAALTSGRVLAGDVVILAGGDRLEGKLFKETSEAVFLDIGYDVIKIPREQIQTIEKEKLEDANAAKESTYARNVKQTDDLYRTGDLPPASLEELTDRLGEGVVMVKSPSGLGSGFVIHEDGYVITNFHVVENETQLSVHIFRKTGGVFRNEKVEDVQIIAVNPFVDLALIKFDVPKDLDITVMHLAENRPLTEGDPVFAIGNPLGLERTVSRGIISKKNRAEGGLTYVQTTTQINPGNSGGPLFNERGEVIGVTNMGYLFAEGLNFAIPITYVIDFLKNRDAYAYDQDNPNSGYQYLEAPPRQDDSPPLFLLPKASQPGKGNAASG
ncbi:MAG TPA: trypsin-like peptidase domain-containing protein [Phycisphaerae bacterium]|nr:trypsin-like peptidase domain-containing protein [Phycisphaerae bacterium]